MKIKTTFQELATLPGSLHPRSIYKLWLYIRPVLSHEPFYQKNAKNKICFFENFFFSSEWKKRFEEIHFNEKKVSVKINDE